MHDGRARAVPVSRVGPSLSCTAVRRFLTLLLILDGFRPICVGPVRRTHSRRSSGAPSPPHAAPACPRTPTTMRGVAIFSAGFKFSESPQAARCNQGGALPTQASHFIREAHAA